MGERTQVEQRSAVTTLAAFDRGAFAGRVEQFLDAEELARVPDDPNVALVAAEAALYLDQVNRAREIVEEMEPLLQASETASGPAGEAARRRLLVACEAAYFEGRFETAETLARRALEAAGSRDPHTRVRARYDLGRIRRRSGRHEEALEVLAQASTEAEAAGNTYYRGLIAFNRAICLYQLDRLPDAEPVFIEALGLLEQSENLRYRALAESSYASLLMDLGRYSTALALLDRAERTALPLALSSDLHAMRNTLAKAMLWLGRYEEAIARLNEVIAFERGAGDHYAELNALNLLIQALVAAGRVDAASRAADDALLLAATVGVPEAALDTQIYAGRVWAAAGRSDARQALEDALERADLHGTPYQRAEARIYLAEALLTSSPLRAEALLGEARAFPVTLESGRLRAEAERVEALRRSAPIRVESPRRFVVELAGPWPTLKEARIALEQFYFRAAMDEASGNMAAAGRLIGETRYQMFYLRNFFEKGHGRPAKTEPSETEREDATPRRDPAVAIRRPRR